LFSKKIYFDFNATAPLRKCARDVFMQALDELGNPSSIHSFGRDIKNKLNASTTKIADLLGISPSRIIFTSGGTESNNTAMKAISGAKTWVSPLEHPSVIEALEKPLFLRVYNSGLVDLDSIDESADLISICLAHNETGIIQDLEAVIDQARKNNAYVHTDAVQALGRIDISQKIFDAHMISFSSHKIGGPLGVGVFVVSEQHSFKPLICGGGQQKGVRSGTQNYPAIVSFASALEEAISQVQEWNKVQELRNYLEDEILKISPDSYIAGKNLKRLPNTSLFSMPGVESMTQVVAFDLEGIAVSAGSACSSGTVKESAALKAMQVPSNHLKSVLRVSLGLDNTKQEIDRFVQVWTRIYNSRKSS
jgi:cysteine desulfurase